MELLPQIVLLLGLAVVGVLLLQRLRVPSTIAYLIAGVILGPGTVGPVIEPGQIEALAEFGIVFLLFTIGLNFSLPELKNLKKQVPLLGTGQVVLTTAVVGGLAWAIGLEPSAAFVVGAVFAQSSTTIIGKQLAEQAEDQSRSGRLGLAMSVFQDVTAVPFVIIIPVLGAVSAGALLGELATATALAAVAVGSVFGLGRWLLRPLFHVVARRRSPEIFTLTVLFVVLLAAWTTSLLGLSLAFGAFLAGMTLGETEFRHQVESTIRPFRDVLLGLFFVAIGMLFEPAAVLNIWYWALLGVVVLILSKVVIVAVLVHASGVDRSAAVRTALVLAVGGEFGLALLAIALGSGTIDGDLSQILLTSVLLSMVVGTFLIRHNRRLGHAIARATPVTRQEQQEQPLRVQGPVEATGHVIICGYGRIGQSVAHFLEAEGIAYVAVDLDAERVREARAAGEPVFYADAGDTEIIDALGSRAARLIVVAHDDVSSALRLLRHVSATRPGLPVMVRTRDEAHVQQLQEAGAFEVVPETLEAGLSIASQTLLLLGVPPAQVARRAQEQRTQHYRLMREFFHGHDPMAATGLGAAEALRAGTVAAASAAAGESVASLEARGVTVTAVVRAGRRIAAPSPDLLLEAGDHIAFYGTSEALAQAARAIGARGT